MKQKRILFAFLVAVLLAISGVTWFVRSRRHQADSPAPASSKNLTGNHRKLFPNPNAAPRERKDTCRRLPVALVTPLDRKPKDISFPLRNSNPPHYNSSSLGFPGFLVLGGNHSTRRIVRRGDENNVVWRPPKGWKASSFSTNPDGTLACVRTYISGKNHKSSFRFLDAENFVTIRQVDFETMLPGMELAGTNWLDPHRFLLLYGCKWKNGEPHPHWEDGAAREANPYSETTLKIYDIRLGRFLPISPESAGIPKTIESVFGFGKYLLLIDKDIVLHGDGKESSEKWFEIKWE
jgi:hypothetical protein